MNSKNRRPRNLRNHNHCRQWTRRKIRANQSRVWSWIMGNSCRKAVNNYVSLSEEATKLRNGLDSPKYNQFANEKRKYNKNDHIMLPRNKSI